MHDVILAKEVERDEDLNRESLDQAETEAREVVHLYEIVEVDRQELKDDHQVLSKHKLLQLLYNVLLVFWVSLVQRLNQLGLDQALFVESLFVFEDL